MRPVLLTAVLVLPACLDHPVEQVRLHRESEASLTVCEAPQAKVDVLIVVDESPSMDEEQAWLERGFDEIAEVYAEAAWRLDSRIHVISSGCADDPDSLGEFASFGPLGSDGCQDEAPLESMRRALLRSFDERDLESGFLRRDAGLFVLFIADADDTSRFPVSRYISLLREIREEKHGLPVFVSVYGGPCESDDAQASAPLRLRQVEAEFAQFDQTYLMCHDTLVVALACLPWGSAIPPLCLDACAADVDDAPGIQPECYVRLGSEPLPPCTQAPEELCYEVRTDKEKLTATNADDMNSSCIDAGWNVEITLRNGWLAPEECLSFTCRESTRRDVDCPDLERRQNSQRPCFHGC